MGTGEAKEVGREVVIGEETGEEEVEIEAAEVVTEEEEAAGDIEMTTNVMAERRIITTLLVTHSKGRTLRTTMINLNMRKLANTPSQQVNSMPLDRTSSSNPNNSSNTNQDSSSSNHPLISMMTMARKMRMRMAVAAEAAPVEATGEATEEGEAEAAEALVAAASTTRRALLSRRPGVTDRSFMHN